MLARILSLIRHNFKLAAADPSPLIVMVLMPLGLMALLIRLSRPLLEPKGYAAVSVAELSVPGVAIMFSFLMITYVGQALFREHSWGTWERLLIAANPAEILLGKTIPVFLLLQLQAFALFSSGSLLFGLKVKGSYLALAIILVSFATFVLALAWLLIAVCRTLGQFAVIGNLAAMLLSGFGGAFAPVEMLPPWAKWLAQFLPTHWAISSLRHTIMEGGGANSALRPAALLFCSAAALFLIALLRFRFGEVKSAEI